MFFNIQWKQIVHSEPVYRVLMNTFDLFSLFFQEFEAVDSFTGASRKLASFIRTNEERCEVPQLIRSLLNAATVPRQKERLLFSFLDVSQADFDIIRQALRLRNLRRLYNKYEQYPDAVTPDEHNLLLQLADSDITCIDTLVRAGRTAATTVRLMAENDAVDKPQRMHLALLLTSEAALLKTRTAWLSDNVDAYNMRAIARLMPLLTICDELTATVQEITERLRNGSPLGRAILTIEYAMKKEAFEKWLKKAGMEPSLHPFLKMISRQRVKLIPVNQLAAVSSISRFLHGNDAAEIFWITHALACCTKEGFSIDTGEEIRRLKPFLPSGSISIEGSVIYSSFASNAFTALIDIDLLPRHLEEELPEPTPRELIRRSINNDVLLLRLLNNPRIVGTPGLVAFIATTSRSLAVLQKIASTTELYTGHANNGVPLALLLNPTHIPLLHLRPFINTRYVSLNDMKQILHNPYNVRKEIHEEIKRFVEQRYR